MLRITHALYNFRGTGQYSCGQEKPKLLPLALISVGWIEIQIKWQGRKKYPSGSSYRTDSADHFDSHLVLIEIQV
jgi:hypothetical protein